MYLETDLDTMVTRDLAVSHEKDVDDIPVYANAEEISLVSPSSFFVSKSTFGKEKKKTHTRVDPSKIWSLFRVFDENVLNNTLLQDILHSKISPFLIYHSIKTYSSLMIYMLLDFKVSNLQTEQIHLKK